MILFLREVKLTIPPVLILSLTDKVQYSFNPNNLVPLDEATTVYPKMRVSDAWGVLTVSNGALLVREGVRVRRVQAPVPNDLNTSPLKGSGWTLELSEGWRVAPGDRKGDLTIKKD